jgi:hypothetical protein
VLERHLKNEWIKYSKATISFDKGAYYKEYKVIRFINLDKLRYFPLILTKFRVKRTYDQSPKEDSDKISEFHLLLFELELNHYELKSALVQVEGRKVNILL